MQGEEHSPMIDPRTPQLQSSGPSPARRVRTGVAVAVVATALTVGGAAWPAFFGAEPSPLSRGTLQAASPGLAQRRAGRHVLRRSGPDRLAGRRRRPVVAHGPADVARRRQSVPPLLRRGREPGPASRGRARLRRRRHPGRLHPHQQPRRRRRRARDRRVRRRAHAVGEGRRHRSAERSRGPEGRRRPASRRCRWPTRRRSGSATSCSRSGIRSASARR